MVSGTFSQIAVAISCMFICMPPSPVIQTTSLSGAPILAPTAAGKPNPIVPRPPEVIICLPLGMVIYCVAHIWCCPTSVTTIPWGKVSLMVSMIICGESPWSRRISSGFSSCHMPIFASHLSVFLASAHSTRRSSAILASETTGTSTTTFREIEDASISRCTIFAFGANSFRSPVILSLNLVPTEKRTSHSLTAIFAAYLPCIPLFPTYRGWSVGMAPLPITVVTTGICIFSAKVVKSSCAPEILTPPPAKSKGCLADFKILYAFFNCPICTVSFGL